MGTNLAAVTNVLAEFFRERPGLPQLDFVFVESICQAQQLCAWVLCVPINPGRLQIALGESLDVEV